VSLSVSEARLPPLAAQLGYAGLIPFVALSIGLWVFPDVYHAQVNSSLLAYAAIILSFMGAVHWGFAIHDSEVDRWQLFMSVVPALIAWFASFADPMINYSILIVAFAGLCVFDGRMVRAGKAPDWYPKLRTPLTAIVVASLILAQLSMVF
jgi:multisubunit Na+/H+ antiporter MnhG subunit